MYASYLPQRLLPDPDTTGSPRRQWNRGILIPPPKSNPTRIDKQSTIPIPTYLSHDGRRWLGLHFRSRSLHTPLKKKILSSARIIDPPHRHFVRSPRQAPHASITIFLDSPDPSGGVHLVDEFAVCLCFATRT
ncbi:hypothetical protein CSOJ01_05048 [Colletotrichum sojae]|uniref:Uncharacterized protein n=1 Tax=Colletotrichum sojae TaxID=2175907 RepID=A0A8H6MXF4_9PEZI|nr:hypothetical protein CSOJ01_05048 [Colletotrichum sojae]